MNRTNVELKLLSFVEIEPDIDDFESNQCGIETSILEGMAKEKAATFESNQCGIETGLSGFSARTVADFESNQCGIETTGRDACRQGCIIGPESWTTG